MLSGHNSMENNGRTMLHYTSLHIVKLSIAWWCGGYMACSILWWVQMKSLLFSVHLAINSGKQWYSESSICSTMQLWIKVLHSTHQHKYCKHRISIVLRSHVAVDHAIERDTTKSDAERSLQDWPKWWTDSFTGPKLNVVVIVSRNGGNPVTHGKKPQLYVSKSFGFEMCLKTGGPFLCHEIWGRYAIDHNGSQWHNVSAMLSTWVYGKFFWEMDSSTKETTSAPPENFRVKDVMTMDRIPTACMPWTLGLLIPLMLGHVLDRSSFTINIDIAHLLLDVPGVNPQDSHPKSCGLGRHEACGQVGVRQERCFLCAEAKVQPLDVARVAQGIPRGWRSPRWSREPRPGTFGVWHTVRPHCIRDMFRRM